MFVKNIQNVKEKLSKDKCHLREVLSPLKSKVDIHYSIAYAVLKPGECSLSHKLRSAEVYVILEGQGWMTVYGQTQKIGKDDIIYIPKNAPQHVENTGTEDLIFLCIVDPPWKKEDEKILD